MTSPQFLYADADFVTDDLAVGGDLDMLDGNLAVLQAAELVGAGITHVLDVRLECHDRDVWAGVGGVEYHWDGIDDVGQQVPVEWFEGVVSWSLDALEDPWAKLLTHCHMGVNRGPSAGYAVLLGLGLDPIEAIEAIRSARPVSFIAYAEDALRWHHRRTGAGPERRAYDEQRLADWRTERDAELYDVIRIVRSVEQG